LDVTRDQMTGRAGLEMASKFFLRIGNAYKEQKNYAEAISHYNKSLIEHFSEKAKDALKLTNELKKKYEETAYLDKGKAVEAKERGNKLYGENKYVEAIHEYSDSLKRDPTVAAVYNNRATAYSKLMDWSKALDDCEKALQIDPKYLKAFIRKAKIQHLLKQYHKAMDTYNAGLKIDPKCGDLLEGRVQTMNAIRKQSSSGQADPERLKEAMKDPDIRAILNDMTIQKVLKDLQDNPQSAQGALADKDIRAKIEKLIAAGVLGVGQ